ncbi:MAG: ATP:cob(I)alamin adenosyltransferase, partial [Cyclobacteriaceae bacterium]|nr:ATP:cob(I)alamin adenosyltransferase [Cyclobacteriaceae bacterium]
MKIYTKTGDDGTTGLYGGSRLLKSHIRIEAYGTIDELNATLGLVHASEKDGEMKSILETIQSKLFNIGSVLASNPDKEKDLPSVDETDIQLLEVTIDEIEKGLTPLKNFI